MISDLPLWPRFRRIALSAFLMGPARGEAGVPSGSFDFPDLKGQLVGVYNRTLELTMLPSSLDREALSAAIAVRVTALRDIETDYAVVIRNLVDYQDRVVNTFSQTNLNGEFSLGVRVSVLGQMRETVGLRLQLLEAARVGNEGCAM